MHDSLDPAPPHLASFSELRQRPLYFGAAAVDEVSDRSRRIEPAFKIATETLAQLGSPALVFDCAGTAIVANRLIKNLTGHIRLCAQNTLSFHDPVAEAMFRNAVRELGKERALSTRTFAARCLGGDTTVIARIVPMRSAPGAINLHRAGMLVFTTLTALDGPPIDLLRSLFDLTPAEARVARGLASGATVDELASCAKVSRNTVRTQLRGIMEKTRCRRQAEAVGLFCRVSIAGSSDEMTAFA